jgi:hypothetical protein
MQQIINGMRYDTETAELIASDRYWDGANYERRGRNVYLYRTRKGRYFAFRTTLWQGEHDRIEPLTPADARRLYESLPVKHLPYEALFGAPEEA